jgi:hypothetical protein
MLGLAVLPYPQTPASASCAAPYLEVPARLVLERGATVMIEGRSFTDGCRDSVGCSTRLGCDSCEYDDSPPTPMDDIELRLVQRDHTWTVDVADAETVGSGHPGWVTWTIEVPANAMPGPAKLLPEHGVPVLIRIS